MDGGCLTAVLGKDRGVFGEPAAGLPAFTTKAEDGDCVSTALLSSSFEKEDHGRRG